MMCSRFVRALVGQKSIVYDWIRVKGREGQCFGSLDFGQVENR